MDCRALNAALTLKLDKMILEPSQSLEVRVGQLFELDEKPDGKAKLRVALFATRADEKDEPLRVLQELDSNVPNQFSPKLYTVASTVPELPDGNYRLEIRLRFGEGEPIAKSTTVRIERGLATRADAAKARAAKIEANLESTKSEPLLSALACSEYQARLVDLANAGEITFDRLNFNAALKTAAEIMDSVEAGQDPFSHRRGDFKKAYHSTVDNTYQPYRVFVPTNYDSSKAYPLVILLHGMGGNEDSYFDGYASGAIKKEAQQRGYILACPKGRDSASMYTGSAEQDVLDVMTEIQRTYRIDSDRVYMSGHSMGGYGTWSVAINHPDIFAAAAPISGGGNILDVPKATRVPMLVVHGDDDRTVPVIRSREMVAAAKKAGAEIKYIEVPGGSHGGVVVPTFKDVFDWFDTHKRSKPLNNVKPEA